MYLVITVILIGVWYTLTKVAEKFVFRPPLPTYPIDFTSCTGNKIRFIQNVPTLEYTVPNAKYTIIYSHGNPTDLLKCDTILADLSRDLGVNVLAYDYCGYGHNGRHGICSEESCYQDIYKVFCYLTSEGIFPNRIILMGTSLGTGPTIDLAKNYNVSGVILRSPFTSIVRIVPYIGDILAWIPFIDIFPNIDKISKVSAPLYIVHGKKDNLVPVEHAYALESKAKNLWQARYIEDGDHCLMKTSEDTILTDLREFIASL